MSNSQPTEQDLTASVAERVWVLDDPRAGTAAQAIGIAERLGVPFRCIPLTWNWMAHVAGLGRWGSLLGLGTAARAGMVSRALAETPGPALVISSGSRSAAVALWLKERYGSRIVHCMRPGVGGMLAHARFDLMVIPRHDRPPKGTNVLTVLGAPHRVSPLILSEAEAAWRERLAHLPHPRVVLLVGGPIHGSDMVPALAHRLGKTVARLTAERGGAVLATTSRRTGAEATDALAAGLSRVLHELYRWGEPGENPYRGFLASADAIVVTADSVVDDQRGLRHRRAGAGGAARAGRFAPPPADRHPGAGRSGAHARPRPLPLAARPPRRGRAHRRRDSDAVCAGLSAHCRAAPQAY